MPTRLGNTLDVTTPSRRTQDISLSELYSDTKAEPSSSAWLAGHINTSEVLPACLWHSDLCSAWMSLSLGKWKNSKTTPDKAGPKEMGDIVGSFGGSTAIHHS